MTCAGKPTHWIVNNKINVSGTTRILYMSLEVVGYLKMSPTR